MPDARFGVDADGPGLRAGNSDRLAARNADLQIGPRLELRVHRGKNVRVVRSRQRDARHHLVRRKAIGIKEQSGFALAPRSVAVAARQGIGREPQMMVYAHGPGLPASPTGPRAESNMHFSSIASGVAGLRSFRCRLLHAALAAKADSAVLRCGSPIAPNPR